MRRLLLLLPLLLLAACSAPPAAEVQSNPLPPAAMPQIRVEAENPGEEIQYAAELRTWERTSQAEDGTPLVTCSYTLPELRPLREDGTEVVTAGTEAERRALEVARAFNGGFSEWTAGGDFEELTQEAQADLEWRRAEDVPWETGYILDLDCEIYQTERFISVTGTHYNYLDGAAHPNMWFISWNFDLAAGAFFAPYFLAEGTELQAAVTEEIIRQASLPGEDGLVPAEFYWEDYRDIAANWSTAAVSFDGEGMVVTFSPYELAAYGFGPQTFRLPYSFLEPYLSDQGRALLGLTEEPS